jgi:glutaredoxin 3
VRESPGGKLIGMSKVVIYTTSMCCYCHRAKDLLRQKGVQFVEIDASARDVRADMIQKAGGRTSVPQIWIGGDHVGGCDDLYALDRAGRLDPMLGPQNA